MTASPDHVTLDAILKHSADAVHQTIGNEAVLLDLRSEAYFSLNELALRVWELLDDRTTLLQIAHVLAAEYDVEQTRLTNDILALADQLVRDGLAIATHSR